MGPDPDALVFTAEAGTPLRHRNFMSRVWHPVLGVTTLSKNITPHALRHTCATLLISKGADPKAIQAQLRHSTISITFDVYGHLFPGHLTAIFDELDADQRSAMGRVG